MINKFDLDNLKVYAEYNGPIHDKDCPGDDTCDCSYHDVNESVNKIIKAMQERWNQLNFLI